MTSNSRHRKPGRFGHDAITDLVLVELVGLGRERAGFAADRRQLSKLPDPADDAIAEPESARVRSTPTSSPSSSSNSPASSSSSTPTTRWRHWYPCSRPRNRPRRWDLSARRRWSMAAPPRCQQHRHLGAHRPHRLNVDVTIANSNRSDRLHPPATAAAPATTSPSRGTARALTAPNGPMATIP